jgi:hypothetical protein
MGGGLQKIMSGLEHQGAGSQASSWVAKGENQPVSGQQVKEAVGADQVAKVAEKLSLSPSSRSFSPRCRWSFRGGRRTSSGRSFGTDARHGSRLIPSQFRPPRRVAHRSLADERWRESRAPCPRVARGQEGRPVGNEEKLPRPLRAGGESDSVEIRVPRGDQSILEVRAVRKWRDARETDEPWEDRSEQWIRLD